MAGGFLGVEGSHTLEHLVNDVRAPDVQGPGNKIVGLEALAIEFH